MEQHENKKKISGKLRFKNTARKDKTLLQQSYKLRVEGRLAISAKTGLKRLSAVKSTIYKSEQWSITSSEVRYKAAQRIKLRSNML